MDIELIIDGNLCDIDTKNFSVLFLRQFLNPAELNTRDVQKSYTITLPATPVNNSIFGYRNIEEVNGKFDNIYDATLIIGGIQVFDGKFRLSETGQTYYTGNLGVPAYQTVNDVFGGLTLDKTGEWYLDDFTDFKEAVARCNKQENAPCIFPFVLYGLLNKHPDNLNTYTPKDQWDNTVTFGIDDLFPSVNCLQLIKQLFINKGLDISGPAFSDRKLKELYMSYQNPEDYHPAWNYGTFGIATISGRWSNYNNLNNDSGDVEIEKTMIKNTEPKINDTRAIYITDMLSSVNGTVDRMENKGYMISRSDSQINGNAYNSYQIRIPVSGIYKIDLAASIELKSAGNGNERWVDGDLAVMGNVFVKAGSETSIDTFEHRRYEIKLVRKKYGEEFDAGSFDIDRDFYYPNINQEYRGEYPQLFPYPGCMCFIDPAQNKQLLCGLSFGKNYERPNPFIEYNGTPDSHAYSNSIALKGGYSLVDTSIEDRYAAAAYCPGYITCQPDTDGNLQYSHSDIFKVDMENSELNVILSTSIQTKGYGTVNQAIYLEEGDIITLIACCDESRNQYGGQYYGAIMQDISYSVSIRAYRHDNTGNGNWISEKMDDNGATTGKLDWDEPSNFDTNKLNLANFLPTEIKTDTFLDDFCKAFNLLLSQTGEKTFRLDIKQAQQAYSGSIIELDGKSTVLRNRSNLPLSLPASYRIGFTVDEEEYGYYQTGEDGGGEYFTGNTEGTTLEQKSGFSYCWYTDIKLSKYNNNSYSFPVITKKEIWDHIESSRDYEEWVGKLYTTQPLRFWYKEGTLKVNGFTTDNEEIEIAVVSNSLSNICNLDYYDNQGSLLQNYFTIFRENKGCYTVVDCYLTAEEYTRLPYSLVRLNGDIYFPAEIDGYDPLGKNAARLKLIRKLN